MVCILIGFVVAYLLFRLAIHVYDTDLSMLLAILALCSAVGGIAIGLFFPVAGYMQPEHYKTIKLYALSDGTTATGSGNLFYVRVNPTNTFSYYTRVESDYATENSDAYIPGIVADPTSVTVVEETHCQEPKLVIYEKKPKRSIWSFAFADSKYDHVFYVPKGTIAHVLSLN